MSESEFNCPWDGCSRSFDSIRGMKSHHVQKHDESIAGVKTSCYFCDSTIRVQKHRKENNVRCFCDTECRNNFYRENHPNEKKLSVKCDSCGCSFLKRQDKVKEHNKNFCSMNCVGDWRSRNWRGQEHPQYTERNTTECACCGDEIKRLNTYIENSDKDFCSSSCQGSWQSENWSGEDSPRWKECTVPRSVYRSVRRFLTEKSWAEIRSEYLSEHSECAMCGDTENLHVHHIVPVMSGGTNEKWNLMALCPVCHTTCERHIEKFIDKHFSENA